MAPSATTSSTTSALRYIPLSYHPAESETSALRLIYALFPEWETEQGEIEFRRFTDGITNTLLKAVKNRRGTDEIQRDQDAILLRAYGNNTDILIDREKEATSHTLLSQKQLAPPLLARFQNGLLYRFIRGSACTPADLIREPVWRGVARRLGQWHAVLPIVNADNSGAATNGDSTNPVNKLHQHGLSPSEAKDKIARIAPGKPQPNVWSIMQKWILALPAGTPDEKDRKELLQTELEKVTEELYNISDLGNNGLVFSHCDLLSGNVIIEPGNSSEKGSGIETVSFCDYEYATPAPAAFDIANHFAEWGGFDCDYNNMPTQRQRKEFLKEYCTTYASLSPDFKREDSENLQKDLFQEIDRFRGVPGFYWGIWALIQATISQIDFDYAAYAETRLGEYWAWKKEVDGSRAQEGKEMPLRERRWAQEK